MIKRRKIIAGNWKMNRASARIIAGALPETRCEVAVFPPFLYIADAAAVPGLTVGAQNCHWEEKGAFTGELSAQMLRAVGAAAVLIGHSERRQLFGETDGTVNKKIHAALAAGLRPYICVGETVSERDAGDALAVVERQLTAALEGVEDYLSLVVAYEPVWAIGTGRTATAKEAQEVCHHLRLCLMHKYGAMAGVLPILYGGSVNEDNAKELFACPDIDGGLIGGASLKPGAFAAIVRAAEESYGEEGHEHGAGCSCGHCAGTHDAPAKAGDCGDGDHCHA
ncbi:MAG TPA: triose-phosphate isomerase [Terriglobales bacterium]|nr:triose-phosphate isomerase [Terriglobales bacterium]